MALPSKVMRIEKYLSGWNRAEWSIVMAPLIHRGICHWYWYPWRCFSRVAQNRRHTKKFKEIGWLTEPLSLYVSVFLWICMYINTSTIFIAEIYRSLFSVGYRSLSLFHLKWYHTTSVIQFLPLISSICPHSSTHPQLSTNHFHYEIFYNYLQRFLFIIYQINAHDETRTLGSFFWQLKERDIVSYLATIYLGALLHNGLPWLCCDACDRLLAKLIWTLSWLVTNLLVTLSRLIIKVKFYDQFTPVTFFVGTWRVPNYSRITNYSLQDN